jgi:hypothetical protein
MGVTPAAHNDTAAGIEEAYAFIRAGTDMNVHHFDEGIPWPEALAGPAIIPTWNRT